MLQLTRATIIRMLSSLSQLMGVEMVIITVLTMISLDLPSSQFSSSLTLVSPVHSFVVLEKSGDLINF